MNGSTTFDPRRVGVQAACVPRWLDGVEYRPGWRWDVTNELGHVRIVVHVPAVDTHDVGLATAERRPPRIGDVQHSHLVPEFLDGRREFLHWFRDVLHRIELHESDEWLRVDGAAPWDPHQDREQRRHRLETLC